MVAALSNQVRPKSRHLSPSLPSPAAHWKPVWNNPLSAVLAEQYDERQVTRRLRGYFCGGAGMRVYAFPPARRAGRRGTLPVRRASRSSDRQVGLHREVERDGTHPRARRASGEELASVALAGCGGGLSGRRRPEGRLLISSSPPLCYCAS